MDKVIISRNYSSIRYKKTASEITAALAVSAGTWLFACFIHSYPIIGVAALFMSAMVMAYYLTSFKELLSVTGLLKFNREVAMYSALVIAVGIALGIVLNIVYHQPIVTLPLKLTAITVAFVGITEELMFRGFIQGMLARYSTFIQSRIHIYTTFNQRRLSRYAILIPILGSAASHTIYKVLVIGSFPIDLGFNLYYLAFFTFTVGILAAWARHSSKSVIPTGLGHGFFDIVVYGSIAVPVWVWG